MLLCFMLCSVCRAKHCHRCVGSGFWRGIYKNKKVSDFSETFCGAENETRDSAYKITGHPFAYQTFSAKCTCLHSSFLSQIYAKKVRVHHIRHTLAKKLWFSSKQQLLFSLSQATFSKGWVRWSFQMTAQWLWKDCPLMARCRSYKTFLALPGLLLLQVSLPHKRGVGLFLLIG